MVKDLNYTSKNFTPASNNQDLVFGMINSCLEEKAITAEDVVSVLTNASKAGDLRRKIVFEEVKIQRWQLKIKSVEEIIAETNC